MKNNILTKGRVMVVEDDAVLRETIVELLTENEWAVTWAIDGADAFSTFRSDPPDVILTDIVMPVCDGLELVKNQTAGLRYSDSNTDRLCDLRSLR